MKKIILTLTITLLTIFSNAAFAYHGVYTKNELNQLNMLRENTIVIIAKAKIAKAEGDTVTLDKNIKKAETNYAAICKIFKKDAIDYVDAGCVSN